MNCSADGNEHSIGGIDFSIGGVEKAIGGVENPIGGIDFPIGGVESPIGGIKTPIGGIEIPIGDIDFPSSGIVQILAKAASRKRKMSQIRVPPNIRPLPVASHPLKIPSYIRNSRSKICFTASQTAHFTLSLTALACEGSGRKALHIHPIMPEHLTAPSTANPFKQTINTHILKPF